ncbi:retrovirus-related pol polyprotein from transposon TNT 1-94, partial [Tanacetum coccineum]
HEFLFLEFVYDINASSKSKSVKKVKKKEEWKPTGKVFTKNRYNWRPTGWTFTLVGNACLLTRITATNKVPLREPIPLEVTTQEFVVTKVYTRSPKVPKTYGSNSKPKIIKSMVSNKTEPGTSRGSNTSVAPSSSSIVDLRPICVASVNGKKYILVIVDDYSRFIWVKFLASKDEAPNFIIKFLKMIQVRLNATVRNVRIDNRIEFVNQTLRDYYEQLLHDRKPDLSYLHVFGALCYLNNDSENLGKFQAKADIGLGLQSMTPATSSSGLVPNPIPQQPCIPPPRDDWNPLFQPMFDEYFNPPTIVVSPVLVAATPRAVDLADSPVSTSIDQDAPSTSIPSTQDQENSPIISQGFEELPKTPHFYDDPLHEFLHEDSTSQGSSSNVRPIHTPFESLGRWTKDHPIANVIGDPSRSVSTRMQLQTDAMWCYLMPS